MKTRYSQTFVLFLALGFLVALVHWLRGTTFTAQAGDDFPPVPEAQVDKTEANIPHGNPVLPQAAGGPDRFGYTWNDTTAYSWIPATTDTGLEGDDKSSDPIPIGFAFPFYENTYTELYVSTNGLITFGSPSYSFENREAPFLVEPQNFIAPFWDDLHVPSSTGGKVYYDSNPDRMVILWQNVARYPNTSDLLTFEAILKKNGDICFQYQTLNGILNEMTVAIEDADGTDGLTYLHNAPGIASLEQSKQLCFIRPAASARVKVLPTYQGGLVINGTQDFLYEVINTGEIGTDSYEFQVASSDPSWQVKLYTSSGSLLGDNDHDGLVESGNIAEGQTLDLRVRLFAPAGAQAGENTLVTITAISQNDPSKQWVVQLHGVVPGPFAQGVVVEDAISLLMVWDQDVVLPVVSPNYTGSTISLSYLPGDNYLYMWEQNGTYVDGNGKNVNFTDLEFATLNGFGIASFGPDKLTDNESASTYTHKIADRSPVATVTDDGKIGIAWVRTITNSDTREEQSNIYFAIYNQNNMSVPLAGPINITQNTGWTSSSTYDVPTYETPRITLTTSSKFVISWSDTRRQPSGYETTIGLTAYNVSGQEQFFVEKVPELVSTPGSILYRTPDVFGLSGDLIFLSFVREDTFAVTSSVGYMTLDSQGNTQEAPYLIPAIQGISPTVLQFPSGLIMMSWLNPENAGTQQVYFATINQSTYDVQSGPTILITPNGLSADLLSASLDNLGNAVLTWMDTEIEQSIYYALVRSDGAVLTQPVQIFDAYGKTITISKLRAGNAAYIGKNHLNLPIIVK